MIKKETMSCQVTTKACVDSKQPNPEDMESKVEHQEVPMEEATLKSSGTMKKQHRGQHLVAGQCREPKELAQRDCRSQRKLATACRKVSHCAAVAQWDKWTRNYGLMEIVDCGRNWPQLAGRWPTVQEWHGARDKTKMMSHQEP